MSVPRIRAHSPIHAGSTLFYTEEDHVALAAVTDHGEVLIHIATGKEGLEQLIKAAQGILAAISPNKLH